MVWKTIKKSVQKLVDGVMNTLLLKPLRAVLKAMGFFKFSQFIEKVVKFVLDIFNFFLDMIGILADLLEFGVKLIEVFIEIASKIGYYSFIETFINNTYTTI